MAPARTRRFPFAVAVGLLLFAASAPLCARTDVRKPLAETYPCRPVGRYCLQSNPWVNLHQRLAHEAQYATPPPKSLAGNDLATWKQAVARYRAWLGNRSAVFDPELGALDDTLARSNARTPAPGLPTEAAEVLESAMPLYLKSQWKTDDRGNRFFIAYVVPMLAQAGPMIISAAEEAYGTAFPTRILVDVTGLGGRFGAYAVGEGDEIHVIQSHTDPDMQGFAALESLIHEPTHAIVAPTDGAIGADITRASNATGVEPRDNLWHALLFYTTGELTRRSFARRGIDYKPLIEHRYDGPFKGMREPFETHWRAYLDGKLPRDEAMKKVLTETSAALPPR